MHWAIWQQLKSPPLGFEEVVRSHFRLRKEQVRLLSCPPDKWFSQQDSPSYLTSQPSRCMTNATVELAQIACTMKSEIWKCS